MLFLAKYASFWRPIVCFFLLSKAASLKCRVGNAEWLFNSLRLTSLELWQVISFHQLLSFFFSFLNPGLPDGCVKLKYNTFGNIPSGLCSRLASWQAKYNENDNVPAGTVVLCLSHRNVKRCRVVRCPILPQELGDARRFWLRGSRCDRGG